MALKQSETRRSEFSLQRVIIRRILSGISAGRSPAYLLRGHGGGAEALHPVVVDEAGLLEGPHSLMDLLVRS